MLVTGCCFQGVGGGCAPGNLKTVTNKQKRTNTINPLFNPLEAKTEDISKSAGDRDLGVRATKHTRTLTIKKRRNTHDNKGLEGVEQ